MRLHDGKGKKEDRTGISVWFGAMEDPPGNAIFDDAR